MHYKQEKDWTCGPSALRNALSNLGFEYSEEYLIKLLNTNPERGTWSNKFIKIKSISLIKIIEKEDINLNELANLIKKGFQIITCFYVKSDKVDHYSLIKEINNKEIIFKDSWFGNNYKMSLDQFKEIWFTDPNFENRKRWIFAIKKN